MSPSPSETTTATTAGTIQSSALVLTPPSSVFPIVPLPEDPADDGLADEDTAHEEGQDDDDGAVRVNAKALEKRQEPQWLDADATEAQTSPDAATGAASRPIPTITTSPEHTPLPLPIVTLPPDAEDTDNERRQSPRSPCAEKADRHFEPTHTRSNSVATQSTSAATTSSARSWASGSSGGVALGLPSSARPSPNASPSRLHAALPPRHRMQPGQPPRSPSLGAPGFGYPIFTGPATPGARSPTPSSPLAYSFAGASAPPWAPGTPPMNHAMAYPRAMHPPPPIHVHPYAPATPSLPPQAIPVPPITQTPTTPHAHAGPSTEKGAFPASEDRQDADTLSDGSQSDSEPENGSPDSNMVVDFPTLNPVPVKKTRGRKKKRSLDAQDVTTVHDDGLPSDSGAPPQMVNAQYPPAPLPVPQDVFYQPYSLHTPTTSVPSPYFHPYPYPTFLPPPQPRSSTASPALVHPNPDFLNRGRDADVPPNEGTSQQVRARSSHLPRGWVSHFYYL